MNNWLFILACLGLAGCASNAAPDTNESEPVAVLRVDKAQINAGAGESMATQALLNMVDDAFPRPGSFETCAELISMIDTSESVELVRVSPTKVDARTRNMSLAYNFPNGDCPRR